MKITKKLNKRIKVLRLLVAALLTILTLFFVFHYNAGLTYAIELTGSESGITVDQSDLFNITNLYPGRPPIEANKPLTIKNTGKSDFKCTITSKQTNGDSRLFDILKIIINDEKGINAYNGNLKDLNEFSLGIIGPKASKLYNLTLELPNDVDNSYQALSTSFQFEISASKQ
jgi:hypothetical protein